MHDAQSCSIAQGIGDLLDDGQHNFNRQQFLLAIVLVKRDTLGKFHHQIGAGLFGQMCFHHLHDVLVLHLLSQLDFSLEHLFVHIGLEDFF